MQYPNLISTSIPQRDVNEIIGAINFINEKLPDLITLNNEELSALPKTGSDTIEFVLDNLKEAEKNLDIVPEDVDLSEIKKDVKLILAINKILDHLKKLQEKLEHSALLAGSEAYLPSIAIYNAIKADALRRRHEPHEVKV